MSQDCQEEACALQACLNKNTYKPEKCDHYLRELYLCCQKMYESAASNTQGAAGTSGKESTACPMESVVKRWLKDHPEPGKS
ncbi:hypothetical protein C8F01DRAFT_1106286 [Mycena amicta]|nr:hypothetical protein C8F01DRAFT_1106286 [Mycena amicta]